MEDNSSHTEKLIPNEELKNQSEIQTETEENKLNFSAQDHSNDSIEEESLETQEHQELPIEISEESKLETNHTSNIQENTKSNLLEEKIPEIQVETQKNEEVFIKFI